jgi:polyhydroxyalkanoate synthase
MDDKNVEPPDLVTQLDLMTNAWIGHFTGNISPAALINAYNDWLVHLRLSPSKQTELVMKACKKILRWNLYAMNVIKTGQPTNWEAQDGIAPLPQDKRFTDPAWGRWPYSVIAQGFLLNQQWWHNATTDVRGVSHHHEDVVTFVTRQILDMCAPSNFLLTNPVVQDQTMHEGGLNLLRGAQNAYADSVRAARKAPDPDGAFKVGKNLAVTPGKVIYRNRLIELIHYSPTGKTVHAVPVLIVPAWIMKYYILDLSQQNSLVKYLVDHGHNVFMISWKNPDADDRDLSMEDYCQLGVMDAINTVTQETGAAQISAVGYCLGGTLLTIAAAAMARDNDNRLANISLFCAQVDFTEPGEMSLFIDESQISFLEAAMWEKGYLDSTEMAGAFQLLRSNDLIWSHRLNQYLLGQKETETDLMTWNADATRMPYRMHTEYLRELFLHNDLAEGRYRVHDQAINLADIHIPIFTVATTTDHVAPWHSVFKIQRLTDTELTFLLTSGGHNAGVVSPPGHPHRSYRVATRNVGDAVIDADAWQSGVAEREGSWWPTWQNWLAAHGGKRIKAPVIASSLCDAPGIYVMQS